MNNKEQGDIIETRRFYIILSIFAIGFLVLVGNLYHLQVNQAAYFTKTAYSI
jgi:cell division protein FtsI/penicillin-binding protein 2